VCIVVKETIVPRPLNFRSAVFLPHFLHSFRGGKWFSPHFSQQVPKKQYLFLKRRQFNGTDDL
jgi:hypothetical protein